jgi:prefoldin subunit 5
MIDLQLEEKLNYIEEQLELLAQEYKSLSVALCGLETREKAREEAARAMQGKMRETLKSRGMLGLAKEMLFQIDKDNGEGKQVG